MISFLQNILSFMNHEKECKSFGSYVIMDMDSLTNGSEIASIRALFQIASMLINTINSFNSSTNVN